MINCSERFKNCFQFSLEGALMSRCQVSELPEGLLCGWRAPSGDASLLLFASWSVATQAVSRSRRNGYFFLSCFSATFTHEIEPMSPLKLVEHGICSQFSEEPTLLGMYT